MIMGKTWLKNKIRSALGLVELVQQIHTINHKLKYFTQAIYSNGLTVTESADQLEAIPSLGVDQIQSLLV